MSRLDQIRNSVLELARPKSASVKDAPVAPPKAALPTTPQSSSPTFNPALTNTILTAPTYRDHLADIYDTRQNANAMDLVRSLVQNDPDASASLNAYLTVADTPVMFLAKDLQNNLDKKSQKLVNQLVNTMSQRYDYTTGFELPHDWGTIAEQNRYMILLRGALADELISDDNGFPLLRRIDPKSFQWFEKISGMPYPRQVQLNGNFLELDKPSIFYTYYRQDPTSLYPMSPFVSAINTIAARQQVINDLYRIMQVTGYPRMDITVMEDVIRKNAPPAIQNDPDKMTVYVSNQINAIRSAVTNLRPDQAFVHTNAMEAGMMNDGKPAMALDIRPVIEVLNGQNQAGLRAMSTILGRGESGVNTASVEARLFALMAQQLNNCIARHWSQILTFALRMAGSLAWVDVQFRPVEMRSALELEPQLTLKQDRMLYALSLGVITDDEYHLEMYGRLPPDGAPLLSGTGFFDAKKASDPSAVSGNPDSLGKKVGGEKAANGNNVKSGQK